jgi:hypothetical protein
MNFVPTIGAASTPSSSLLPLQHHQAYPVFTAARLGRSLTLADTGRDVDAILAGVSKYQSGSFNDNTGKAVPRRGRQARAYVVEQNNADGSRVCTTSSMRMAGTGLSNVWRKETVVVPCPPLPVTTPAPTTTTTTSTTAAPPKFGESPLCKRLFMLNERDHPASVPREVIALVPCPAGAAEGQVLTEPSTTTTTTTTTTTAQEPVPVAVPDQAPVAAAEKCMSKALFRMGSGMLAFLKEGEVEVDCADKPKMCVYSAVGTGPAAWPLGDATITAPCEVKIVSFTR